MPGSELVDHCLELLAPLGALHARPMFGGHGIYFDELFFALIADGRLYLKVDAASRAAFERAGCAPFVYRGQSRPITLSYWSPPDEALESPAAMLPWARLAVQAALAARNAAAKGPRSSKAPASVGPRRRRPT